jgi:RNA polymerase sigma-70 factor (ECF subfamily)
MDTSTVLGAGFASTLAAAQAGDEAAFAELWRDLNPALLRYLRVIAGDVAEDVASETWTYAVPRLVRFKGDETAWRAWVFTTARRRVVDEQRRRSRRQLVLVADPSIVAAEAQPDSADVAVEQIGTENILALIVQLPPMQAEVIVLRVVAGLPVESVGRMLGRSPGSIRVATHRGLKGLAALLAPAGVTH